MVRENGTVEVVSTNDGWFITGRGRVSTLRMKINRCTCNKHVCSTLHLAGALGSCAGAPSLYDHGPNPGHGRNHCHHGHVERVRRVVDAIARTYGPTVKRS